MIQKSALTSMFHINTVYKEYFGNLFSHLQQKLSENAEDETDLHSISHILTVLPVTRSMSWKHEKV